MTNTQRSNEGEPEVPVIIQNNSDALLRLSWESEEGVWKTVNVKQVVIRPLSQDKRTWPSSGTPPGLHRGPRKCVNPIPQRFRGEKQRVAHRGGKARRRGGKGRRRVGKGRRRGASGKVWRLKKK